MVLPYGTDKRGQQQAREAARLRAQLDPGVGGGTVPSIPFGGNTGYSPLNDRSQTTQASGATIPAVAAQTRTAQQTAVPSGTGTMPGGLGFLSEAEMEMVRNIPGYAEAMIRRAKTGGKRDMSGGGALREGMMGQALKALLAMIMPNNAGTAQANYVGGPMEQANAGLADLVSGATSGGGFGGVLRNQAANLMGQDFSVLKDDEIYRMLAAAQGAATYGYGDFAQFAPENALAELQNTYQNSFLNGNTTNVLGQPGALNAFQELLQQYLGTQ